MPRKTQRTRTLPNVKESAHEIWLAGLGAFAMAGEEGNKVFDDLVKKGRNLESAGKSRLEQVLGRVREARTDARQAIGRVAAPIDDAASGALQRMGVPTRKEIQSLTRRVEELTRVVEARAKAPGRKARKSTKRAGAKSARSTAKRATK